MRKIYFYQTAPEVTTLEKRKKLNDSVFLGLVFLQCLPFSLNIKTCQNKFTEFVVYLQHVHQSSASQTVGRRQTALLFISFVQYNILIGFTLVFM